MATQIQHRRGSTAQHATFTGAIAEITVDTTKKTAVIHDGSTAGGVPLAREDQKNDGAFGYAQEIKTDNYAVVASDTGKMLIANKATAITFTLGAAASLTSKFVAVFKNINAGALSIAPTGVELIDGANASITVPTGASVIIKCDGSAFRTYLSNGDVTGKAINTAPALTGANLADNDKLGVYDVSAGALASTLFSELIAGIFKTARTIANAQFASASFKLFNAASKALTFDTTALTADRKATMPDRDVDLGLVVPADVKAWVNFNGTGTVAIRASKNVSSITDNGTGDYTINFATPMPDINYAATLTSAVTASGGGSIGWLAVELLTNATTLSRTISTFRFLTSTPSASADSPSINAIFTR